MMTQLHEVIPGFINGIKRRQVSVFPKLVICGIYWDKNQYDLKNFEVGSLFTAK